jgi:hypothetical protein
MGLHKCTHPTPSIFLYLHRYANYGVNKPVQAILDALFDGLQRLEVRWMAPPAPWPPPSSSVPLKILSDPPLTRMSLEWHAIMDKIFDLKHCVPLPLRVGPWRP